MKIILLGAPGAGKGTQAEKICEALSVPSISTGDIIRSALKSGSEIGMKAKSYMDSGDLVPDEIVIYIVKERISHPDCKNGFVLDGFPRTIPQAEALDNMGVGIDKVIEFKVSDETIVKRMSGRRVCEKCSTGYNMLYKKPRVEGKCDKCSGTLIQRKDDTPETVKARLIVYHKQTEPLKDYYKAQGKLIVIDGEQEIKDITQKALKALGV